jgi:hypothetical protein
MASTCPAAVDLERAEVVLKSVESSLLLHYPSVVTHSSQGDDLVRWSKGAECGAAWLRQKHDYVVLWQSEPRKRVVLFKPSEKTSVRFAQRLLHALQERGFALGECSEGENLCTCGVLVEHLLTRRITNGDELAELFDAAKYR